MVSYDEDEYKISLRFTLTRPLPVRVAGLGGVVGDDETGFVDVAPADPGGLVDEARRREMARAVMAICKEEEPVTDCRRWSPLLSAELSFALSPGASRDMGMRLMKLNRFDHFPPRSLNPLNTLATINTEKQARIELNLLVG